LVFQTFSIISTTATIMTEFYQKAVEKVKISDHKTTANPTGKWVSMVKGSNSLTKFSKDDENCTREHVA
jgi:hypothetical protein